MGKLYPGINDLYTWCMENGDYGQQLLSEWTGKDENDNDIDIHYISRGNNTKMKWVCKNGHTFLCSPNTRTYRHNNCLYCAGQKATTDNNLYQWCIENGEIGQLLLTEWTGYDSEDKTIDMHNVMKGSGRKVKWKCNNGHEFIAKINNRTSTNRTMCPYCIANGTSYPEQFIYYAIKEYFCNSINRYKLSLYADLEIELDIFVPELNTAIEYSPSYWHQDKIDRDNFKIDECNKNNIRLIYISDNNIEETGEIFEPNYICTDMGRTMNDEKLIKISEYILQTLGVDNISINYDDIKIKAFNASKGINEVENSLASEYPLLCDEIFDKDKIDPSKIKSGSGIRLKWQCKSCKYVFETDVHSRAIRKSGCPKCGYNWYKEQIGEQQKIREYLTDDNYTELLKEFNDKNTVNASEISVQSNYELFWTCPYCDYGSNGEWSKIIKERTAKGYETGCPECGYNWHRAQIGEAQHIKKKYKDMIRMTSYFNNMI